MSDKIENLNKIASFMLVSIALSATCQAKNISNNQNLLAGFSSQMPSSGVSVYSQVISMYAVIENPSIKPIPQPIKPIEPIIAKYAAPSFEIEEQIHRPILMKYAAPQYFKNQIDVQKMESIDSNINKTNIKNNLKASPINIEKNSGDFKNKKSSENLSKIDIYTNSGEFDYKKDGKITTLKPVSYSFYKN